MKKLTIVLLCIILLTGAAACATPTESQVVTPAAEYATIHFEVYSELYEFEAPQDMVVEVGTTPTLPFPEGAVPMDEHDDLAWFADQDLMVPYDTTRPVTADLTLYLYEVGKTYAVSYQGFEGWTVEGDYVYSYQYDGESKPLPTATRDGYSKGLYCPELNNHYVKVPTSAGKDLTFMPPKAIVYAIVYNSGIEGVSIAEIDNPNPTQYSEVGGVLTLLPATYGDNTSVRWVVRLRNAAKTFVVDGEEVTLRDNTAVTYLTYEMIRWGGFVLEAQWN